MCVYVYKHTKTQRHTEMHIYPLKLSKYCIKNSDCLRLLFLRSKMKCRPIILFKTFNIDIYFVNKSGKCPDSRENKMKMCKNSQKNIQLSNTV